MFVKVVNSKGFSAAAQELNISPTAVSKQIKNLEDILNVQLIERTTTKFKITEIGEVFYSHCIRILNDMDNLQDIAKSFSSKPSGRLKIFSSVVFGETFILPHLRDFVLRYPDVVIEFDLTDRIPDVQAESIDLCIGLIGHWDQALIQKKLFKTTPSLFASPSYIERYGEPKTRDELFDHHFIGHSNRPDPLTINFEEGDPLIVRASLFVNNIKALLQCAIDGLGIAYLHDYMAEAAVKEVKLIPILDHEKIPSATYYAFYSSTYHIKPATRVFLDHILMKLKNQKVEP
jgi:DNA-binding transcriptional LysR family regulator